jgi:hypothetical protein
MAAELTADDAADLTAANHLMYLLHTGPLYIVGFTGQQHDFFQRCLALEAVKIKMGVPVTVGAEQFELLFGGTDAMWNVLSALPYGKVFWFTLATVGGTLGALVLLNLDE